MMPIAATDTLAVKTTAARTSGDLVWPVMLRPQAPFSLESGLAAPSPDTTTPLAPQAEAASKGAVLGESDMPTGEDLPSSQDVSLPALSVEKEPPAPNQALQFCDHRKMQAAETTLPAQADTETSTPRFPNFALSAPMTPVKDQPHRIAADAEAARAPTNDRSDGGAACPPEIPSPDAVTDAGTVPISRAATEPLHSAAVMPTTVAPEHLETPAADAQIIHAQHTKNVPSDARNALPTTEPAATLNRAAISGTNRRDTERSPSAPLEAKQIRSRPPSLGFDAPHTPTKSTSNTTDPDPKGRVATDAVSMSKAENLKGQNDLRQGRETSFPARSIAPPSSLAQAIDGSTKATPLPIPSPAQPLLSQPIATQTNLTGTASARLIAAAPPRGKSMSTLPTPAQETPTRTGNAVSSPPAQPTLTHGNPDQLIPPHPDAASPPPDQVAPPEQAPEPARPSQPKATLSMIAPAQLATPANSQMVAEIDAQGDSTSSSPAELAMDVSGASPGTFTSRHDASAPLAPTGSPLAHSVSRQIAVSVAQLPDQPVEITLSPEELGRVRLVLHASEHGMAVSVQAERSETLDLMRRNIGLLAGDMRDLGYSEVSFSFSDHPQHQSGQTDAETVAQAINTRREPSAAPAPSSPTPASPELTRQATGLDLRI